jgi:hypothetical protein
MIIPWSNGWRMLLQFGRKTQLPRPFGDLCLGDEQPTGK